MKRSNRVILIAIVALTFSAIILHQPALLSGTVMGLLTLYFQSKQRQKNSSLRQSASAEQALPFKRHTSSQPDNLAKSVRTLTRARVYIDEPNIFSGAYNNNLRIKYDHLAPALAQQGYSVEKIFLYAMEKPESNGYPSFLNRMEKSGIEVIERRARKTRDDVIRKDIDTWLATDIALDISEIDTVILVTGDNDFSYTVTRLQEMKKRVIVIGIEAITSQELREQADQWFNITHLHGVCERKVRPPKLRKSDVSSNKIHRHPRTTKPILKHATNKVVKIIKHNRTSA